MLRTLTIKNFAIIDNINIVFDNGFNIITGESGAGKSVLVKALAVLTGLRIDDVFIKDKSFNAVISAEFDNLNEQLQILLAYNNISNKSNCTITRVFDNKGSKIFVDDKQISLKLLKKIAHLLINISSQNSHQLLLNNSHQLKILDNYINQKELLNDIKNTYKKLKNINTQLEQLTVDDSKNELDFIDFQLQEFDNIGVNQEEITTIEHDYNIISQSETLVKNLGEVIKNIQLIENAMKDSKSLLDKSLKIDSKLNNCYELISNASININECGYELNNYLSKISGVNNLKEIENRISLLYDLSRKHNCSIKDLLTVKNNIANRKKSLINRQKNAALLNDERDKTLDKYNKLAIKLSEHRARFAKKLAKQITQTIKKLAMPFASFDINVTSDKEILSQNGFDTIEFVINTNNNEFKSLKKIVSGGELSRINLAIAVVSNIEEYAPTFFFDEVDNGISGEIAKTIALELKKLSTKHQIICITHLPQIAAKSDKHMIINKYSNNIQYLTGDKKFIALANMISGKNITDNTIKLVKEMVNN